ENRDLWEALLAEVARHDVTWHKVAGHSGHDLTTAPTPWPARPSPSAEPRYIFVVAGMTLFPLRSMERVVVAWSMRDSSASRRRWPIPSSSRARAKRSTTSSGVPATM